MQMTLHFNLLLNKYAGWLKKAAGSHMAVYNPDVAKEFYQKQLLHQNFKLANI
jgi:hypothetical protein